MATLPKGFFSRLHPEQPLCSFPYKTWNRICQILEDIRGRDGIIIEKTASPLGYGWRITLDTDLLTKADADLDVRQRSIETNTFLIENEDETETEKSAFQLFDFGSEEANPSAPITIASKGSAAEMETQNGVDFVVRRISDDGTREIGYTKLEALTYKADTEIDGSTKSIDKKTVGGENPVDYIQLHNFNRAGEDLSTTLTNVHSTIQFLCRENGELKYAKLKADIGNGRLIFVHDGISNLNNTIFYANAKNDTTIHISEQPIRIKFINALDSNGETPIDDYVEFGLNQLTDYSKNIYLPIVNNGTLHISVDNGTPIEFSANQSSDVWLNIPIASRINEYISDAVIERVIEEINQDSVLDVLRSELYTYLDTQINNAIAGIGQCECDPEAQQEAIIAEADSRYWKKNGTKEDTNTAISGHIGTLNVNSLTIDGTTLDDWLSDWFEHRTGITITQLVNMQVTIRELQEQVSRLTDLIEH